MNNLLKTKKSKIVAIVILSVVLIVVLVGIFASLKRSEGVKGKADSNYLVRAVLEDDSEYSQSISLEGFVVNGQGISQ